MSRSENKKLQALLAYLLAALLGAVGQLCFKAAASSGLSFVAPLLLNPYLLFAILLYIGIMVLFIYGLKCWGEISVLYPVYGSTFVFALVFSSVWSDERPSLTAVAGTFLIVIGIALIAPKKELT